MPDTTSPVTQTEVGQQGGSDSGFPPFNTETFPSQLFWFAIVFIALYLTMARVALPRVAAIFKTRADRIAKDLDEAHALQAKVESARADHEKTLVEAKASAQALAQTTRTNLAKEADAKRKTLESELHGQMTAAEQQITLVKTQAMSHVEEIARETAAGIVARLSGQSVDADTIAKAVSAART